jgi:molybdopterin converting factor subunit 1
MKLIVRYFASLKDAAGCTQETLDVADGADVTALWRAIEARHPALAGLGYRPLVACDRSYAGWDQPLEGVDEVAFLPPVSGG